MMPENNLWVVLDANVLFPFLLQDTLLRAVEQELFQSFWSEEILDEVERNLVKFQKMDATKSKWLIEIMKRVFPEAMVSDYENITPSMKNDLKDRHVMAAAVKCGAQIIVTNNLKDFKPAEEGIVVISPDDFLIELLRRFPVIMKQVLLNQAQSLRNPPLRLIDLLKGLKKIVPKFVSEFEKIS